MSGQSLPNTFFSDSYETATSRFTTLAEAANARHLSAPTPHSDDTIELALLGDVRANTLMIHSSGVHGVEGYVGSAIQLAILEARPRVDDTQAILFIHVVNPSGRRLGRRWTANNVDLKRNFFEIAPNLDPDPLYQRIDAFLNPQRESALKGFRPKALLLIARYGYSPLQQAVAQGQFHTPKGLFYGGREQEPETQTLLAAIRALHLQPQVVMGLDVHAGLGHFGEHQLLLEPFYSQEQADVLHQVLDHDIIPVSPGSPSTYAIKGGFIAGMKALFEPSATTYWLHRGVWHPRPHSPSQSAASRKLTTSSSPALRGGSGPPTPSKPHFAPTTTVGAPVLWKPARPCLRDYYGGTSRPQQLDRSR